MSESMMWKARDRGLLEFRAHDIRDHTEDKHRTVDDTPYGGGGGMILKPDVLVRAIEAIKPGDNTPVILMSPQGRLLTHQSRAGTVDARATDTGLRALRRRGRARA